MYHNSFMGSHSYVSRLIHGLICMCNTTQARMAYSCVGEWWSPMSHISMDESRHIWMGAPCLTYQWKTIIHATHEYAMRAWVASRIQMSPWMSDDTYVETRSRHSREWWSPIDMWDITHPSLDASCGDVAAWGNGGLYANLKWFIHIWYESFIYNSFMRDCTHSYIL